ncbi:MAG: hypothetical protein V7709_13805 [Halioglobus sp.]
MSNQNTSCSTGAAPSTVVAAAKTTGRKRDTRAAGLSSEPEVQA